MKLYFLFYKMFFKPLVSTNEENITIHNECEEMNGWYGIDSHLDLTITAPNIHWGEFKGTIELNKDETIKADYVLKIVLSKDGYKQTNKFYIYKDEKQNCYYLGEENGGIGYRMYKKSDE